MDRKKKLLSALLPRILVLLLIACAIPVHAQDFDLYVQGTITDAATGEPIGFAQLAVRDELDPSFDAVLWTPPNGDYTRELYTNAVWDGARYKLEYSADGYLPRTAIIDASAVERGVDLTTAWRINMDVELYPLSMEDEAPPMELGECIYETSRGNFRWTDREARKEFPIKRYREPRIVAHAALVDSVSTLDGVMLQGRTLAQVGENELENVQVHVRSQDGAVDTTLVTDRFGFYIYSLPFEKEYHLTFSRQDLVSKKLSIDLTGIPEQRQENGFSTILDVRLFPAIEDEDLSFLDRPLGRMRYMPSVDNLSWDVEYSRPLLERLDDILSRHMATSSVR